jgi:hypothetical protein
MNTTTQALVSEMNTLRAAVKAHHDKIVAAQVARDEAIEAACVPTKYGFYTVDLAKDGWRYPAVQAATDLATKLEDDNGYFWACSRLRDLENLLGLGAAQLPLRTVDLYVPLFHGHIPAADSSVSGFLMAA